MKTCQHCKHDHNREESAPAYCDNCGLEMVEIAASKTEPSGTGPRLYCVAGKLRGRCYPLGKDRVLLGRNDKTVDILLPDERVSREHLLLILQEGRWFVEELKTTNPTKLGERWLSPGDRQELRPNDVIQVGHICLRFDLAAA